MNATDQPQTMVPSAAVLQLVDEWNGRAKSLRKMGMHKEASVLERCADDLAQRIKEVATGAKTTPPQDNVSPCCKAKWLWEQMGGMRIYQEVNGEKHYNVMCDNCRQHYEVKDPP